MRELFFRSALAARSPLRVARRVRGMALEARAKTLGRFVGEALRWDVEDGTLVVTLDRAPCNEIGTTALAELELLAAFLRTGAGGARALVFHSAIDRGFSAGADLRELYDGLMREKGRSRILLANDVASFLDRIHDAFDAFDTAPLTTIASVHGVVFGGGFELALTCDVIVAEKSARFCFPELRLGLVPGFGGIPRLNRDLGNALVRDLLLTGRSVSATRAHEVGLVSQLVGKGQGLEVARSVAAQAARFDRHTSSAAKRFMKRIPRAELEREKAVFLSLFASEASIAGLRTFVQSTDVMPYLP